ncbi:tRNA (adenosine(37)-N6)-threonylcarbamoyltransferase complex dimerization subunit type 1 TsaB [Pelistega sp. NLN82]|uniref:tRNA (Adenosine(37)-N6)-threonylcarbamoyltransferase complex dimerization subunit type 1 TsaB n=1 Tax=Pelistega ratti TaxID=2652177 RepID=A0A6L9Y6M5_9BURK|nr:tRNA (adenosine(37)-N6)-threonylcarbamoyltransferase complex dimerization subunit type 1 TsaB [Pelistega ratti]NEN76120.1 tRNA (adenosine(37)-N6)-threonylcarbamoyltransferase complex dimerization subunit type 1 TsaB [Pelistega ratti]
MINFIAIENAANGASIALLQEINDEQTIKYAAHHEEGKNAEQVLPMIDELLRQANLSKKDLHGIVFSQGPGGFTGLRVACGLAQGLALGLNLPIIPVSSLEASAVLSQSLIEDGFLVVALDARMQEVYLAVYQITNGSLVETPVLAPTLMQAQDVIPWIQQQLPVWCLLYRKVIKTVSIGVTGNAVQAYPDAFILPSTQWVAGTTTWANADTLVQIGYAKFKKGFQAAVEDLAPLYLRDKVAFTTEERESGMGGNPKIALPVQDEVTQQLAELANTLMLKDYWIRPLKISDLPAVMAIEEKAHLTPWTEGMFMAAFMHIHYHSWALVNADNDVLAYAVQLFDPDVVNLMTIAVVPCLQGQGLGTLLLTWLECYIASQPKPPYQQLLEVRVSNTSALALYQRFGYEQIGIRKRYYDTADGGKEDALVLQKQIKPSVKDMV